MQCTHTMYSVCLLQRFTESQLSLLCMATFSARRAPMLSMDLINVENSRIFTVKLQMV